MACPLQNLDRGVGFGSTLSPRMLGCCEVGPVASWALSGASGWQAQLSVKQRPRLWPMVQAQVRVPAKADLRAVFLL